MHAPPASGKDGDFPRTVIRNVGQTLLARDSTAQPSRPRQQGPGEDPDLGLVDEHRIVERQVGDEQRDGEADARRARRRRTAARGCTPRGSVPQPARSAEERRAARCRRSLPSDEAGDDRPASAGWPSASLERAAAERDAGVGEREQRHDDERAPRVQAVLERARRSDRTGISRPSATPAIVACTPDSCTATHSASPSGDVGRPAPTRTRPQQRDDREDAPPRAESHAERCRRSRRSR